MTSRRARLSSFRLALRREGGRSFTCEELLFRELYALPTKKFTGSKLLFDMRGFWADERVDGGLWPKGGDLYRLARSRSGFLLESADHIVTLTRAFESRGQGGESPGLRRRIASLSVIPTCADLSLFSAPSDQGAGAIYARLCRVGRHMVSSRRNPDFLSGPAIGARPEARLLFVNRNEHALIRGLGAAWNIVGAI